MQFPFVKLLVKATNKGPELSNWLPVGVVPDDVVVVICGPVTSTFAASKSTTPLIINPSNLIGPVEVCAPNANGGFITANDTRYALINSTLGVWQNISNKADYLLALPTNIITASLGSLSLGNTFKHNSSLFGIGEYLYHTYTHIKMWTSDYQIRLYNQAFCFSLDVPLTSANELSLSPLYFWKSGDGGESEDLKNGRWIASFCPPATTAVLLEQEFYFACPDASPNNNYCFPFIQQDWIRFDTSSKKTTWEPVLSTEFRPACWDMTRSKPENHTSFFNINRYLEGGVDASLDVAYGFPGLLFSATGLIKQTAIP